MSSRTIARAAIALLVLFAGPLTAQVTLSGSVYDGSGGPFLSGTVYHATGNLIIPSGETLTVQAGAIVKIDPTHYVDIFGTLNVTGAAGNPAVFTSIHDDSIGGDTGGDGPTVGSPGDWRYLFFRSSSDASTLDHALIRFAGSSAGGGIDLNSADVTISNTTVEKCAAAGLDLNNSSFPTVTDCQFNENDVAVREVPIMAVPGFHTSTAANNTSNNGMDLSTAGVTADTTITDENVINALVMDSTVTISSTFTLTLEAGVVYKVTGSTIYLDVFGTLVCNGTNTDPVVFTSFADDSHAGDTNADGASTGTAGDWDQIYFRSGSDASTLTKTRIRFSGGGGGNGVIDLNSADITMTDCVVEHAPEPALHLNNSSFPTISGCSFDHCTLAVDGVAMMAVPGFTNNTATGNSVGNYMRLTAANVTGPTTITANNVLGGALHAPSTFTVASGTSLTLGAGVTMKFTGVNTYLDVFGELHANGTVLEPVVFTSLADDAFGGDTNNDGPSTGTPGEWDQLFFRSSSDASSLTHAIVRFAGGGTGGGAVELSTADITMTGCLVEKCLTAAVDLTGSSFPAIEDCAFNECDIPIDGAAWAAFPNFRYVTATGNTVRDLATASQATTGNVVIEKHNVPNGIIWATHSPTVSSGDSLTLGAGIVCKFASGFLDVFGTLNVTGTGIEPVVLTSHEDDQYGGDSNGDGNATTGAPGQWGGVFLRSGSSGLVRGVVIRHGGTSAANLELRSGSAFSLRDVRSEHSQSVGIKVWSLVGDVENCVAYGNATDGFEVAGTASTVDFVHCTSVGNGGFGIELQSSVTGTLVNSVTWNNAGGELSGFNPGDVLTSLADATFAGVNGNVAGDPLFVDEANGDLRLTSLSPALDAAAIPIANLIVTDIAGGSRRTDSELLGNVLPDMGAHEKAPWVMSFTGRPRLGESMSFSVSGPLGISLFAVGPLGAHEFFADYGFLTVGLQSTVIQLGMPQLTGQVVNAPIPNIPAIAGFPFGVQAVTVLATNTTFGAFTNRWTGKIID